MKWVLAERISVCFFRSPGKTTLVWKPLHYILCLRLFSFLNATSYTDYRWAWGLACGCRFSQELLYFPFNTMGKNRKVLLAIFFTFYVVVYFSLSLEHGIVFSGLHGYLLFPILAKLWVLSSVTHMLRVVIDESQVSRFWQENAGQQQFVAYLPVFFNILKYLSILFNILLIAVWRVIPAIKFAISQKLKLVP